MQDGLTKKVDAAVYRLRLYEPPEGYYLAFSGGKDSVAVKALMDMAGVKYDATYRVTSVDPPELVRFIKEKHPDVIREIPRYSMHYSNEKLRGKPVTMWNLIPEELMPPTRLVRYCCEKLKETAGEGRLTVTGVRWAESVNRAKNQGAVVIHGDFRPDEVEGQETLFDDDLDLVINERHGSLILTADNDKNRKLVEHCFRLRKTIVNPIIEWSDADVWEFIRAENIPYCGLYDEGQTRIGCIGCPMAGTAARLGQFDRWPKYKVHYLKSFERMLLRRIERNQKHPKFPVWRNYCGSSKRPTPNDVFNWWMELPPDY